MLVVRVYDERALIEMVTWPVLSYRFNLVNHNYHGVDTSKYGEQK